MIINVLEIYLCAWKISKNLYVGRVEIEEIIGLDATEAVAASGALPSLFQPVVIGDRILIDGGVTNNFPVEEPAKYPPAEDNPADIYDIVTGSHISNKSPM